MVLNNFPSMFETYIDAEIESDGTKYEKRVFRVY